MTVLLKQRNTKYQKQINAKLTVSLFPRKLCHQEKKKRRKNKKKAKHTQKTLQPQNN